VTPSEDDRGEEAQKTPEEIRQDIEQTREQLGDTVEALAEKTDVKAQAKHRVSAVKETVQGKKDEYISMAKAGAPESAGAGAQQVASTVQRRPLPFAAAGAFAVGVLVGRLLGRG
jgi:ElaB/YqjD/DUF883 family membrane-anchored ribosome-binding protein